MLELAPDLSLPPEAALQRFGILAMSGAGKSNTAVVMAEEMYRAEIPWVAVDPKGDWWGIRSSRSGKGPGLEVPVFGGLHGDLPLEETAGKMMAELIAETRLTCILDVSEFPSKAAQLRFLTDFAETLLKKNREPLHIFAEEADEYLPQKVMKTEARCVGAWTRLVKRGRFRGIFVTLVTQRSAALSKDALSQVDTLMPMRTPAPRDKKAIEEWVVQHDFGRELLDSLPSLADGEVWIWSPHRLKLKERHRFRRRRTFDSGETPTLEGGRPAAKLADVDLEVVKERMAETIERAKQDDPRALRAEVRRLEKTLSEAQGQPREVQVEVPIEIEVPVFPEELRTAVLIALTDGLNGVLELAKTIEERIEQVKAIAEKNPGSTQGQPREKIRRPQPAIQKSQRASEVTRPDYGHDRNAHPEADRLPKAARKMLEVLVQRHPAKLSRSQLATLAGYSRNSSTIPNSLTTLRAARMKGEPLMNEGDGLLWAAEGAFTLIGDPPPPAEGAELRAQWRAALPGSNGATGAFFDALEQAYPDGLTRAQLAEATGYSLSSSTIPNTLTTLRRNGLISEAGELIFMTEDLFA